MKENFKKSVLNYTLNIAIIILLAISAYLIYSLFTRTTSSGILPGADTSKTKITNQPNISIQINVLNGTGENRVAARFRDFLKEKGFDVVDMGNFKSSDIEKSYIIDKAGEMVKAKRIADALGISYRDIVQEINKSQFIDASVVIGKDFNQLKPFTEKNK